jgi:Ca2+-binding RTX toxin-like protein
MSRSKGLREGSETNQSPRNAPCSRVADICDSLRRLLRGSAAPDQLRGNDGNDRMYGAAGVDEFHAGSGEDLIDGGPGNDLLQTGWKDDDVILGGDGNDTMFDLPFDPEMWPSDPGRDSVDGGAGDDSLSALDQVGSPEPDSVTCGRATTSSSPYARRRYVVRRSSCHSPGVSAS